MKLNGNFELAVSIGDANKAALALRSYGLTVQEAEEVISKESVVAIYDHGIIPKKAIAPDIIELFGMQHINDAISYLYYYMDEFDIDWEVMQMVLSTMLRVLRPEEIVLNPDCIRLFIESILVLITEKTEDELEFTTDSLLFANILNDLADEDIKEYCDMADDCSDEEV